ncbi:MAG: glycosyltransferase family 4 protein [Nitrososphaeria archaeon]
MSAMHPSLPSFFKKLVSLLKPDLTLIQSYETESMFKRLGCRVEFLPCGVDVKKFTPVTAETKIKLRKKYGIEKEKFVILHVGSIKEGRNIQFLTKLQKEDNQVLIIGATSTGINQKLCQELRKSGCLVWTKYFEHIEEIYGLSDCYVFPVMFKVDFTGRPVSDSIEMPLSIIEAMACNLPVISTKFGALPRIFHEKEGLIYANREEDFLQAVKKIKNGINVRNREKVLPYSWEKVAEKLQQIYSYLISKY